MRFFKKSAQKLNCAALFQKKRAKKLGRLRVVFVVGVGEIGGTRREEDVVVYLL
jgi:hypothetical protein